MRTFCHPSILALLFLIEPAFPALAESVPQTIVSPLGTKMRLKFDDEFSAVIDKDGKPYIDRSKWQTTFWQGSSERTLIGNAEAQYYVDKDYAGRGEIKPEQKINPFSFEKPGLLTISAMKVPEASWHNYWMSNQRCFASGLLISDKAFTFQYGYVEGRFKLPDNRGAWPAFWLLGNDPALGDAAKAHEWPPEIDIFEFMGHWKTKFSSALHVRKGPAEKVNPWTLRYNEVGIDLTKDFHTWGVEWNAEETALTFDGKIWLRGKTAPSMQRKMYLLVNLAVGGSWFSDEMKNTGTPSAAWEVDTASMPWKMEVDYVRVYQP